jgi:tRNA A37 threonylcarbamoyladenosine biosynthesis protein TsaE
MDEVLDRVQGVTIQKRRTKAFDDNKVVYDTFKIASDTYTLVQGYKHTCEMMHMVWCNIKM